MSKVKLNTHEVPTKSAGVRLINGEMMLCFHASRIKYFYSIEKNGFERTRDAVLDSSSRHGLYVEGVFKNTDIYKIFEQSNEIAQFKLFILNTVNNTVPKKWNQYNKKLVEIILLQSQNTAISEFLILLLNLHAWMNSDEFETLNEFAAIDDNYLKLLFVFHRYKKRKSKVVTGAVDIYGLTKDVIKENNICVNQYICMRYLAHIVKRKAEVESLYELSKIFTTVFHIELKPLQLILERLPHEACIKFEITNKLKINLVHYSNIRYKIIGSHCKTYYTMDQSTFAQEVGKVFESLLDFEFIDIYNSIQLKLFEIADRDNNMLISIINKNDISSEDVNQNKGFTSHVIQAFTFDKWIANFISKWNIEMPLYKINKSYKDSESSRYYYRNKDWITMFIYLIRALINFPNLTSIVNTFNFNGAISILLTRSINYTRCNLNTDLYLDGNNVKEITGGSALSIKFYIELFKRYQIIGSDYSENLFSSFDALIEYGISKENLFGFIGFRTHVTDIVPTNLIQYLVLLIKKFGVKKTNMWVKLYISRTTDRIYYNLIQYKDYIVMCGQLDIEAQYIKPFETIKVFDEIKNEVIIENKIKQYHNNAQAALRSIKYQKFDEVLYKIFENHSQKFEKAHTKKYILILPSTTSQIVEEGQQLNHCVASYIPKIVEGKSIITFLRLKSNADKSLYTIELKVNHGVYSAVQKRGFKNTELNTEAKNELKVILENIHS